MRILTFWALLCFGCNGATNPDLDRVTEQALELVWGGTYGMDFISRPQIQWLFDCSHDLEFGAMASDSLCVERTVTGWGVIKLRWHGNFHDSSWSDSLMMWRYFVLEGRLASSYTTEDDQLVKEANDQLIAIGL